MSLVSLSDKMHTNHNCWLDINTSHKHTTVIFKPELKSFSGTDLSDKAHVNRMNRESITESLKRFTHTLSYRTGNYKIALHSLYPASHLPSAV